jgi:hypothetical protein
VPKELSAPDYVIPYEQKVQWWPTIPTIGAVSLSKKLEIKRWLVVLAELCERQLGEIGLQPHDAIAG